MKNIRMTPITQISLTCPSGCSPLAVKSWGERADSWDPGTSSASSDGQQLTEEEPLQPLHSSG